MHDDNQVRSTRAYYDSAGAEGFYSTIWGGEDLHIGVYETHEESIRDASRRTVELMAAQVPIDETTRVLDIGAGYGGSARVLARTYGCRVTCLNLSAVQNDRNRRLTADQGLSDLVDVVEGTFEDLPFPADAFHLVWSQDAILHSAHRDRVLAEVARVLIPGGRFLFTDPMQADEADRAELAPVLERLDLESLASPSYYEREAARQGLRLERFVDLSPHLPTHYGRVLEELERREAAVRERSGDDYVERMKRGLANWVDAGRAGSLVWGIVLFAAAT